MINLSSFALRHFSPTFRGTRLAGVSISDFVQSVESRVNSGSATMTAGYADFCKHIWLPNLWGARSPVVKITPDNERMLETTYTRRVPTELPYLARFFPSGMPCETANFVDVIVYSGQQLRDVEAESGDWTGRSWQDNDWGIVNIMGTLECKEQPIPPETMIRNALGPEFGGSGVPLDRALYEASVEFWSQHAISLY